MDYNTLISKFIPWYSSQEFGETFTMDDPFLISEITDHLETWMDLDTTPDSSDTSWSHGLWTWDEGIFIWNTTIDNTYKGD